MGIREKILKMRAKAKGMTVPEYQEYMKKRKAEMKRFREELKRKEREEKKKFEKWKITEKYKRKRKQIKSGKKQEGLLGLLGGSEEQGEDPLGLFGSPKKSRKKRKKRKR